MDEYQHVAQLMADGHLRCGEEEATKSRKQCPKNWATVDISWSGSTGLVRMLAQRMNNYCRELETEMANYARGRDLEYEVKSLFEAHGWDVMRGSGSKGKVDGFKTDLVATKRTRANKKFVYMVLMQCKREEI